MTGISRVRGTAAAEGGGGGGAGGRGRAAAHHEYLATLGHELRGPLQALRLAIAALEREPDDRLVRERVMRSLRRQVTHLSRLAEDLVDAAASERGDLTVHLEPLELGCGGARGDRGPARRAGRRRAGPPPGAASRTGRPAVDGV